MKINKLWSIVKMLVITVAITMILPSCDSESEHEPKLDTNEVRAFLKSKKWYCYDEDVWTWGDNNLSYDQTSSWIYFSSDSDGFFYSVLRSTDSALGYYKNTYIDKFTYSISGNSVDINQSGVHTRINLKGKMLEGYNPIDLTQEDYTLISNTMGNQSDIGSKLETSVLNNVKVSFDKKSHIITVKSNLRSVFPYQKLSYLLDYKCYSYHSTSPFYSDSNTYEYEGNMSEGEQIMCGWNCTFSEDAVDAMMCSNSIQNLETMFESGERLYDSQFELYTGCQNTLYRLISQYNHIEIILYIVVDGAKVQILETRDDFDFDDYAGKYEVIECSSCNGTGVGTYWYSTCSNCKGSGYTFRRR